MKLAKSSKQKVEEVEKETSDVEDDDFVEVTEADKKTEKTEMKYLKLDEGVNYLYVLPPKKSFKIDRPWIESSEYFFGKDFTDIFGPLPDEMPICQRSVSTVAIKNPYEKLKRKLLSGDAACVKFAQSFYPRKVRYCNVVKKDDSKVYLFRLPFSVYETLNEALEYGEYFSSPKNGLMPIKVTRTGVGITTKYTSKVLTKDPKVPIKQEWKDTMYNLRDELPPIPAKADVENWVEMFLSVTDPTTLAEDEVPF